MTAQIDLFADRFEVVREPVSNHHEPARTDLVRPGSSTRFEHRFEAENEARTDPGSFPDSSMISPVRPGSSVFAENLNDFAGSTGSPFRGLYLEPVRPELRPNRGSSADAPPGSLGARVASSDQDQNQTAEPPRTGPEPDPETRSAGRAPSLRPYQVDALAGIAAELAKGVRRTLLVLPTGAGKTVVFSEQIRRMLAETGKRALVLAHRGELLKQAQRKLLDVGVLAGIEKAEMRAGHAPVVVASVQTLKVARLKRLRASDFGIVVVDEAHHATAKSYRDVLTHFDEVPILGVTATPDRADGTALREVFESVAFRYEIRQAIRDKYLAPIRARRVVVKDLDLSSVRVRAGDLAQDDLAAIMSAEGVMHGIASPLVEQAGDRKTIVFAVDVANAHALAAVLNRYRGGSARAVDGSADELTRTMLLEDFARGEFQFLVNCALLTEGFDEPSVSCIAIARPTKSRALYTQMVGRGTRLFPGKDACLLLDFVGNSGRHKLVGPIDALAPGEVSDDVYGEASDMLADGEGDLEEVLDEAAKALERKRSAALATVRARYFTSDVDPFLGDDMPAIARFKGDDQPATQMQIGDILNAGIKQVPPELTRGDAERILAGIKARRKNGLSTVKQSAVLKRFGVNVRRLTFEDAGLLMGALVRSNYNPRALEAEMRRLESIKRRSWQS